MEANDLNKSGEKEKDLNAVNPTKNEQNENTETANESNNDSTDVSKESVSEENTVEKNTVNNENETIEQPVATEEKSESIENRDSEQTESIATEEKTDKDDEDDKPTLEKVNLSSFSRENLVARLLFLNKTFEIPLIKNEVEEIKASFYRLYHEEVEELKKRFLASGELEENFAPPIDTLEIEIKNLLKDFKHKKSIYINKLEGEKEQNLIVKNEIIDAIKNLVNRQESLNETFNEFRELQQRFHAIGSIPQNKVRDVWDTYNLHIENFYNYVKINKELRDLDLKKNLTLKVELCEKAELLIEESSVVNSFKTLQKHHDQWRQIGPVPKENKDELWERFKAATTKINQKHQEYFEGLKDQLKENLKLKTELCEKAELIVEETAHSPKEWEEKSKNLIEIQQSWKTIGFAPKKDNNAIYERFRSACDKFFENKRDFFKHYKDEQQQHLIQKTELCEKAETMKENTDWKKTTDEYIKIQKQWKEIGPVPRRQSDAIWHRFRKACDAFFDNKSEFFSKIDESQDDNLKLKIALIEEVKSLKNSEDNEETFKMLQDFQHRFYEIGHVPFKEKDKVNQEFRSEINKHFDNLNMDEYHKNVQKFRNRIENIKNSGHQDDKVFQERHKLLVKLKQLETDITVWENNIGFFAKSKSSEALLKDFQHKIENGKRSIKLLQEKIKMLNKMQE